MKIATNAVMFCPVTFSVYQDGRLQGVLRSSDGAVELAGVHEGEVRIAAAIGAVPLRTVLRVQVSEESVLLLRLREKVIRSSYMIPFAVLVSFIALPAMGAGKALPVGFILCMELLIILRFYIDPGREFSVESLLPFVVLLLYYGWGKGRSLFEAVRL